MKMASQTKSVVLAGLVVVVSVVLTMGTAAAQEPGDKCAGVIANKAAAAGVCGPVCSKEGLTYGGNWGSDKTHPPVKECLRTNKGSSVCQCIAPASASKIAAAKQPGNKCAPMISNNTAAAGVCGPVCSKEGLMFGGPWKNDRNNPLVQECTRTAKGASTCECSVPKPVSKPGGR